VRTGAGRARRRKPRHRQELLFREALALSSMLPGVTTSGSAATGWYFARRRFARTGCAKMRLLFGLSPLFPTTSRHPRRLRSRNRQRPRADCQVPDRRRLGECWVENMLTTFGYQATAQTPIVSRVLALEVEIGTFNFFGLIRHPQRSSLSAESCGCGAL